MQTCTPALSNISEVSFQRVPSGHLFFFWVWIQLLAAGVSCLFISLFSFCSWVVSGGVSCFGGFSGGWLSGGGASRSVFRGCSGVSQHLVCQRVCLLKWVLESSSSHPFPVPVFYLFAPFALLLGLLQGIQPQMLQSWLDWPDGNPNPGTNAPLPLVTMRIPYLNREGIGMLRLKNRSIKKIWRFPHFTIPCGLAELMPERYLICSWAASRAVASESIRIQGRWGYLKYIWFISIYS